MAAVLFCHLNQKVSFQIQGNHLLHPTFLVRPTNHTCQNGANQEIVLALDLAINLFHSIKNQKDLSESTTKAPVQTLP
jgi:hypothetical protein